jgi:hypothetical protein
MLCSRGTCSVASRANMRRFVTVSKWSGGPAACFRRKFPSTSCTPSTDVPRTCSLPNSRSAAFDGAGPHVGGGKNGRTARFERAGGTVSLSYMPVNRQPHGPVLMKPFSSRSLSGGSQSAHGFAPIIENVACVWMATFVSVSTHSRRREEAIPSVAAEVTRWTTKSSGICLLTSAATFPFGL